CGDDERTPSLEALVEQTLPLFERAHLAEELGPCRFAAVHRRDAEVVPGGPIEVDDDRLVAERLRDRPRDRRQELGKVTFHAHELRDLEEAAERTDGRRLGHAENQGLGPLPCPGYRQLSGWPGTPEGLRLHDERRKRKGGRAAALSFRSGTRLAVAVA